MPGGVRVRPVTSSQSAKRVTVKNQITQAMQKNRLQRHNIQRIEQSLEKEIEVSRANLEQKYEGEVFGGLYHGIGQSDVASNVTLHKGE